MGLARLAVRFADRTTDWNLIRAAHSAWSSLLSVRGEHADQLNAARSFVDQLMKKGAPQAVQLHARIDLARALGRAGHDARPMLQEIHDDAAQAGLKDPLLVAAAELADLEPAEQAWTLLEPLWHDHDLIETVEPVTCVTLGSSLVRIARDLHDVQLLRAAHSWTDKHNAAPSTGSHEDLAEACLWDDDWRGSLCELLLALGVPVPRERRLAGLPKPTHYSPTPSDRRMVTRPRTSALTPSLSRTPSRSLRWRRFPRLGPPTLDGGRSKRSGGPWSRTRSVRRSSPRPGRSGAQISACDWLQP